MTPMTYAATPLPTLADCTPPAVRLRQLLAIGVDPAHQDRQLGDHLLELMLAHLRTSDGIERVVAVSRCRNYPLHRSQYSHAAYIAQRDAADWPLDPILRFHAEHGARIEGEIPGFRPADEDNQGAGVLIAYDLHDRRLPEHSSSATLPQSKDVARTVHNCIEQVLGPARQQTYQPDARLMAMGLESLDLLELRHLLSQQLGQTLDTSFFFRCSTPQAIIEYFQNPTDRDIPTEPSTPERVQHTPPTAEEFTEARQGYAIIGIGCRFPGSASTPEQFWALLHAGIDTIRETPPTRVSGEHDSPWFGAYLDEIDQFDAGFFQITPREARLLDPQQRLLLEVVWEALEDAGLAPAGLTGSSTGVFVGAMSHDYEAMLLKQAPRESLDAYFATGNAASIAAGRLAYFFDWHGPALTLDTACSSSLVAVHQGLSQPGAR